MCGGEGEWGGAMAVEVLVQAVSALPPPYQDLCSLVYQEAECLPTGAQTSILLWLFFRGVSLLKF